MKLKGLKIAKDIISNPLGSLGDAANFAGNKLKEVTSQGIKQLAKAVIKALLRLIKYIVVTPPLNMIALIILIVLSLVGFFFICFYPVDNAVAADEYEKGIEYRPEYIDYENLTCAPKTDDNESYVDEYQFRLPKELFYEFERKFFGDRDYIYLDSTGKYIGYFNEEGKYVYDSAKYPDAKKISREEFMKDYVFEGLDPEYTGDYYDNDVYKTYKYVVVGHTRDGGAIYGWRLQSTKLVKRHIIPEARSWEGVYKRKYEQKTYYVGDRSSTPGATYVEQILWEFTTTEEKIEFQNLYGFMKVLVPNFEKHDVANMADNIYIFMGKADGESSDGQYEINGGSLEWPVPGTTADNISSKFKTRERPDHTGLDIAANTGAGVVAAEAGQVVLSLDMETSYGHHVIIYHGELNGTPTYTLYAHLSKRSVSVGDIVTRGQKVGEVGNTGNSRGAHLHFEVRLNQNSSTSAVDPLPYITAITDAGGVKLSAEEYTNLILPGAISSYKKYGVLPSITLAQGAIETGWGENVIRGSNNFFGIKADSSWNGPFIYALSPEEENGIKVTRRSKFRVYPNIAASIEDHGKFLLGASYAGVLRATNYKDAAIALQAGGYATDSKYADSLIRTIRFNNWQKYDTQVLSK